MDWKKKCWETIKVGRETGLSNVEKTSQKYCINYMASINPFSVAAVKTFAWAITK